MKRVFIGSSGEAVSIAKKVKDILDELGAETTLWTDTSAFPVGENSLDYIINAAHTNHAGLFIFNTDDEIIVSGSKTFVPRDNVVLEAGLFCGVLGKKNIAICQVSGAQIPTDFAGVVHVEYNIAKRNIMKDKLSIWLNNVSTVIPAVDKNVLMLSRKKIQDMYSIDSRLHISDNIYAQVRSIKMMNFASNLFLNPEYADCGHVAQMQNIPLSYALEKIMSTPDGKATLELILTKPTDFNLYDIKTKIANHKAQSSAGAVYSALDSVYKMLTDSNSIYYKAYSGPVRFHFRVLKIATPFSIFNVEFLGDYNIYNHVKVDLYSASIDNEDNRRSFIVWQSDDPDNYKFFVDNFNNIMNNEALVDEPSLTDLKKWSEIWRNMENKNGVH